MTMTFGVMFSSMVTLVTVVNHDIPVGNPMPATQKCEGITTQAGARHSNSHIGHSPQVTLLSLVPFSKVNNQILVNVLELLCCVSILICLLSTTDSFLDITRFTAVHMDLWFATIYPSSLYVKHNLIL